VNRTKQFRNIPRRSFGSALDSLPDDKKISRAGHHAGDVATFHFPSEKGDFCKVSWSFFALRDQNNFHIFRDLYQRSLQDRYSEEGTFGC
jgi:hypothetical protein